MKQFFGGLFWGNMKRPEIDGPNLWLTIPFGKKVPFVNKQSNQYVVNAASYWFSIG